jgi:hypothetical protein
MLLLVDRATWNRIMTGKVASLVRPRGQPASQPASPPASQPTSRPTSRPQVRQQQIALAEFERGFLEGARFGRNVAWHHRPSATYQSR